MLDRVLKGKICDTVIAVVAIALDTSHAACASDADTLTAAEGCASVLRDGADAMP